MGGARSAREVRVAVIALSLICLALTSAPALATVPPPGSQGMTMPTATADMVVGSISAGGWPVCAIRPNGPLACWGLDNPGQATPPGGTFKAISGGFRHSCAIRTNGTLACWGDNNNGQATPPAGTFTAVEVGGEHSCAL